jgi:hypothetical protein
MELLNAETTADPPPTAKDDNQRNKQQQGQKQVLRLRRRMTTKNRHQQRQLQQRMRGSLHCGGKCAAFGRDDITLQWLNAKTTADPPPAAKDDN